MKYMKECLILFSVTLAGELLNRMLPFPVPAGVYGMFLLLFLLCAGAVRLEQIESISGFLLEIMPLLFVPPTVALLTIYDEAVVIIVPLTVICIVSTIATNAVTGLTAQWIIQRGKKKKEEQ
ncbi:MAG: CidA/LrgA family protein [Clostridiales bacterium]|nr:CidA/LrgA family protein [Clostridiales bacterium]